MAKTITTSTPVVTSIYIVENGRALVFQFAKFDVLIVEIWLMGLQGTT